MHDTARSKNLVTKLLTDPGFDDILDNSRCKSLKIIEIDINALCVRFSNGTVLAEATRACNWFVAGDTRELAWAPRHYWRVKNLGDFEKLDFRHREFLTPLYKRRC